jgi:hypothetical protein
VEIARKMQQQIEGPVVGVMQVFKYEHQRLPVGHGAEEIRDTLKQAESVLVGVTTAAPRLDARWNGKIRDDASNFGGVVPKLVAQVIEIALDHETMQDVGKGLIWRRWVALVAVADKHAGTLTGRVAAHLLTERGFADTRFADDGDHRAMPSDRGVDRLCQVPKLSLAPNEDFA